jgi:2-keto-4-pentenoate hydratase/2-oxohepta-3-ene-1,7-dioic acid hydratase in catechol pathway
MVFDVAKLISHVSQYMTLLPGDIIATGTPEGVGAASGNFLKAGDRIEAEVEGIGILHSKVVRP